jgi:hypothetical protein
VGALKLSALATEAMAVILSKGAMSFCQPRVASPVSVRYPSSGHGQPWRPFASSESELPRQGHAHGHAAPRGRGEPRSGSLSAARADGPEKRPGGRITGHWPGSVVRRHCFRTPARH